MPKNSFVIYTDYQDQINLLPDQDAGYLLKALIKYVKDGERPEQDPEKGMANMAFAFIAAQIDRDSEKYEETIEKRREAGRRGGQANAKQKEANASKAKQTQANQADNVNDNVNVNVNDNKKESIKKSAERFTPPSTESITEYCQERGINIDIDHFIDYYTANGWKVGKNPMKDWKAAVRNWAKNDKTFRGKGFIEEVKKTPKKHNFKGREYDFEALERQLAGS